MTNVDVGGDSLNLYVVGPARFNHSLDGDMTLDDKPCFVDIDNAVESMRHLAEVRDRTMVMYKLVEIDRRETRG